MATAKGSEQNRLVVDEPVAGFPLKFIWNSAWNLSSIYNEIW